MARYSFTYCSAPTGFGWREETDTLGWVKRFITDHNKETCSAGFLVWDNKKNECLYDKDAFCYKPHTDKLF